MNLSKEEKVDLVVYHFNKRKEDVEVLDDSILDHLLNIIKYGAN